MQKKYTLSLVFYERQIKIVDAQIDRQVYDLYGLTEEEIKVLENESRESIDQQVKLGLDMVDVVLNTFARYGK